MFILSCSNKTFVIYFFLLIFYTTNCGFCQEDAYRILNSSFKAIEGKTSVEYQVRYAMKYFDKEDTLRIKGYVYLLRNKKDSIFNGMIRLATTDSIYKFYDMSRIYVVMKSKNFVKEYNPHKDEKFGMTGNASFYTVWEDFLKPNKLIGYKNEKITLLHDTIIDGNLCYRVAIKFPDEEEFTNRRLDIFINKKDSIPVRTVSIVKFQGNYQYKEFSMSAYRFNHVSLKTFSKNQIPKSYKIEAYTDNPNKLQLLEKGTNAPTIWGKFYQKNLKTDTINYRGKITLIDFWYMACDPCRRAIKQIEKIRDQYPDLQIIGLNAYDNNETSIKKIPTFLSFNNIPYPIVLIDKSMADLFRVKAWPTFYLIDREGKIQYTSMGYSDSLSNEIGSIVNSLSK